MRVLIAEDDAALSMFLKRGLELEGHSVEFTSDGESALKAALASPPDLLILDLNLPGKDGIQILTELQKVTPALSILILTGRGSVEDRVSCLDLGADDYLLSLFPFMNCWPAAGLSTGGRELQPPQSSSMAI